jgi:hypothetical protein
MSAIPFLVGAIVGIMSALLTIFITPSLQHYFWRRQRHAERQMTIIDEVSTLAAEARELLLHPELLHHAEDLNDKQRQLYGMLLKAQVNVKALFSGPVFKEFISLDHTIREAISQADTADFDTRHLIDKHLLFTHSLSLNAMYRDLGIPTPPFGQWLRAQGWDPLLRGWRERWWPAVHQRVATGTTRLRQSRERRKRRRSGMRQPPSDIGR